MYLFIWLQLKNLLLRNSFRHAAKCTKWVDFSSRLIGFIDRLVPSLFSFVRCPPRTDQQLILKWLLIKVQKFCCLSHRCLRKRTANSKHILFIYHKKIFLAQYKQQAHPRYLLWTNSLRRISSKAANYLKAKIIKICLSFESNNFVEAIFSRFKTISQFQNSEYFRNINRSDRS